MTKSLDYGRFDRRIEKVYKIVDVRLLENDELYVSNISWRVYAVDF